MKSFSILIFAGLADHLKQSQIHLHIDSEIVYVKTLKQHLKESYPEASAMIQQSFMSVNQSFANDDQVVKELDELALIPPVSGGQSISSLYELTYQPIQIEDVSNKVNHPDHGAALIFVGTTREHTTGKRTLLLEYEAYEPMALRMMRQIGDEIAVRFPDSRTAITHRLGRVPIGEASVVIAVSTPHRKDCYEASRYIIERLKQIVPIWKKEIWEDGSKWQGHQLGPWDPTKPYHASEAQSHE